MGACVCARTGTGGEVGATRQASWAWQGAPSSHTQLLDSYSLLLIITQLLDFSPGVGDTPLHRAVRERRPASVCSALLRRGAEFGNTVINDDGDSPEMIADAELRSGLGGREALRAGGRVGRGEG